MDGYDLGEKVAPEPRSANCGHQPHYGRGLCKSCYMKAWRAANRQHVRDSLRQWKTDNPTRVVLHDRRRKPQKSAYYHRYWRTQGNKKRARFIAQEAVRRGDISRQPCQSCGNLRAELHHHEGYDKPLAVIWLCRSCHVKEHLKYA